MKLSILTGIFDINSDEAFFRSLCRSAQELKQSKVKDTERLLYLLMGANHLREWIAPGLKPKKDIPSSPAQHFHLAIYHLPEYRIINALCNRSKHQSSADYVLDVEYGANVDDWENWDAVNDIDLGPPIGYRVNGRDLLEIVDVVLAFYKVHWYDASHR